MHKTLLELVVIVPYSYSVLLSCNLNITRDSKYVVKLLTSWSLGFQRASLDGVADVVFILVKLKPLNVTVNETMFGSIKETTSYIKRIQFTLSVSNIDIKCR